MVKPKIKRVSLNKYLNFVWLQLKPWFIGITSFHTSINHPYYKFHLKYIDHPTRNFYDSIKQQREIERRSYQRVMIAGYFNEEETKRDLLKIETYVDILRSISESLLLNISKWKAICISKESFAYKYYRLKTWHTSTTIYSVSKLDFSKDLLW